MDIKVGSRMRVHYNLHRGDYSVIDPKTGRVVANVETITLANVEFRVSEKTRQRTLAQQRRTVHAYAIGTVVSVNANDPTDSLTAVTYNPFRSGQFHVKATGYPVTHASRVSFRGAYCYIP